VPCSQDHFIPILDEIRARPDPGDPETIRRQKHPGWGGRRPGAGAPKGNLNALKHGRTSRRKAQLLEGALDIPEIRQTLIDLANRERRRRKKAEEGYGVMMTRLLEKVAEIVLQGSPAEAGDLPSPAPAGEGPGVREDGQGQNNQEFLDFLNTATAEMRKILRKPSRRRRTTIKQKAAGPNPQDPNS
jgi:hypothetical protein